MNTGIEIVFRNKYHKLMRGIYKITVGNKFYIGQASRVAERIYAHESCINWCLKRYGMPKKYEKHYIKMAKYLHENPSINTLYVDVVQKCVSTWDLFYAESVWLNEHKSNPDCLNTAFLVPRRYIDDSLWDAEIAKDGLLYYFDPSDPDQKRYHLCTPLTKSGKIAKQNTYIRSVDKENNDTA